ncbi:MAG: multicopper oxidase family protein, partial [Hamadaea sp.]|nr:multicopper oxidase family protein [Hamadaea sp.]
VAAAARAATLLALGGAGWWFVEEKVVIGVPLAVVTTAAALTLALPRLITAAARAGSTGGSPAVAVPLLSAGYAGVAGLLVSVVHGYPATGPAALIASAAVLTATLVTWRVMAAPPATFWRGGLAAAVAAFLAGVAYALVPSAALGVQPGHDGHARPVTELRGASAAEPGGQVRRQTLAARKATVTLASGKAVDAWTFDGASPGPALTATVGDLIEITLRNVDIETGVTLHWHGYDVPAGEDGVPGLTQEAVPPGREFVYRFAAQQSGTYWYHTHSVSHRGVRMGLFGTLVVAPRDAAVTGLDVTLPAHTFGSTLALGDNDGLDEKAAQPGTPVRLRLINTDSTPQRFTLAGTPFRVVAMDGVDLSGPAEVTETAMLIPAGGRYDVAFTMPANPVTLRAGGDRGPGLRLGAPSGGADIATGAWPVLDPLGYGTPAPTSLGPVDRDLTLVLDRGVRFSGGAKYAHTVNGAAAPDIPVQTVREGEIVRFTIVNRSLAIHPWHLHGHHVLILSRDGRAPTGSPLWLDSFDVLPGEVWQVAFRADNPGVWANHCHNLDHAAAGMTLHLAYEGVTTPFHGSHG